MPDSHCADEARAALRVTVRAARDAIAPAVRTAATAAACARVIDTLAGLPAGAIVGLYAAIRGELATDAIADAARARGLVLAYPRVVTGARQLAFHLADTADLTPGCLRIPEPAAAAPVVAVSALAAIVVPGLVFDRGGHRLGWGRGHYDATLPPATAALRIGLGFELQLVTKLPVKPHDCPVHLIATEVALHPGVSRVGTAASVADARKGPPP